MAVAAAALLGLGKIQNYSQFTAAIRESAASVTYRPRSQYQELYRPLYRRFCHLHPALKALWQSSGD